MIKFALLGMSAIALLGAASQAEDGSAPRGDVIAGRQAAFRLSAATFGGMKSVIDSGGDVKKLAFPARGIASWARAIPGMFPAASGGAPSHALPTVWSDRAGFEKAAANYAAAADTLAAMAKAGDSAGFATQWGEVRKTCNACHKSYREKDER